MPILARKRASIPLTVCSLALIALASCSGDGGVATQSAQGGPDASVAIDPAASSIDPALALARAKINGQPADTSRSTVQLGADVQIAYPARSLPFTSLPQPAGAGEVIEHEPLRPARPTRNAPAPKPEVDLFAQSQIPIVSMPATIENFAGQGRALGGPCVSGTSCSTPPDTNGVVGPNHYVQATNVNGSAGLAIWNKSGTLLAGPKHLNALWTGFSSADGNTCASGNDGDPVVVYDQLADRWFITQFALPNSGTNGGPSFQCVAVSQTADPTGAYYLYDFKYAYSINDYGKFGIWPDAYYASFNMFNASGYVGADFCAYDRNQMLKGLAATQQCFLKLYPTNPPACPAVQPFGVFGALPISMDGPIPPPNGEPAYFMQFDYSQCGPTYNQLDLWTFHVDWATPANSSVTGPSVLTVGNFTPTCYANNATGGTGFPNCVPQPGTTVTVDALDDRVMFRLNYRNFGSYESLLVNHSIVGGNGTGGTPGTAGSGIRWYEIRSPATAPAVFQQGTYAPSDTNWRWMGSIAQDQASDMALGYGISSNGAPGVAFPSIAWTGRLNSDAVNTMGQAEAVIDLGGGVEGDAYPAGGGQKDEHRGRWGDYSNMTVDPSDDCTLWYTQELYRQNAIGGWDTYIGSVKFPNCAANDFRITLAPATGNVVQGGTATYTVTTAVLAGATETIALSIQDLPQGVTGALNPPSVTTGGTSTLTLTAAANAPLTGAPAPTFMVIGKATSAVHAATAQIAVVACGATGQLCCAPGSTCSAGDVCTAGTCAPCGAAGEACCTGNACTAPAICNGGSCCAPVTTCPVGDNCGTVTNGCGGTLNCGTCSGAQQQCVANKCTCVPTTTCPAGDVCGTVSDGCGGTVNCGTCSGAQQQCQANKCVCVPATTCPAGDVCGTVSNGCGGTINCGTCSGAQQQCQANQCVCVPTTACPAGDVCGTVPNGCGGTVNCGTCSGAQQQCQANQCVCQPLTTCGAGQTCGTIPDGCGGQVTCGSCGATQTCTNNACVNVVVDAGTGMDSGPGNDSGAGGDASAGTDSGSGNDSGITGNDSGIQPDGGGGPDASASNMDGSADGGAGATPGTTSGCGCKVAGTRNNAGSPALLGFGALAMIAGVRARRRRRS